MPFLRFLLSGEGRERASPCACMVRVQQHANFGENPQKRMAQTGGVAQRRRLTWENKGENVYSAQKQRLTFVQKANKILLAFS